MRSRAPILQVFPALVLAALIPLRALQAQTNEHGPRKLGPSTKPEKTVDVIVHVGAYDWMDNAGFEAFGRQFNTLVVRIEKVEAGVVFDPWIRVDYYGSNRHQKQSRLPDEIFEPGHRWHMRLMPTPIAEANSLYCQPRQSGTLKEVDATSGEVIDEVSTIRSLSNDLRDVPDVSQLKCYALKREDLHELKESE